MKITNYILFLLIAGMLFMFSCVEKKPEKDPVKKQIFTERSVQNAVEQVPVESKDAEESTFHISQSQFDEYNMILGTAGMEQLYEGIAAAGYIEVPKENKAELRSYIGGYLQSSPLLPGNYVQKGQFLISLNNLEYIQLQQDYLQAKEELSYLKAVYERKKTLADENITSKNSMQQAETDYNMAMANVEGLRKKLQLINIDPDKICAENMVSSINLYAPISGYITLANAVKGQFVEPTDVIFEITRTDHLHLELKVYEKDILKVKKGQQIAFRIPEAENGIYSGEVFLVGKTIDEADRTVTVHCHITEAAEIPLVVGMYVEADIFVDTYEKFCLHADAIVREEGKYYVFVNTDISEDGYTFVKTLVDVGEINETCVEIADKSRQEMEGKQILLKGAFNL